MKINQAELIGTFEQDTPEWHQARTTMVGGSDVAAVLGLSDWKSAYTLWHEKNGLIEPEPRSEDAQRKMDYGHHMEPFVASLFAKAHPEYTVYETGTWRNLHRPWQGCNPDRLLVMGDRPVEDAHSLLQIKTANWDSDWLDGPPEDYMAQVRWEMDTFGFATGYLAVYFNVGGKYREYVITADPFDQEAVRAKVLGFWQADGPPEIDGLESTYRTVRRLNPSIERGLDRELPVDIASAYLYAAQDYKRADGELNKAKGHLLAHMGTAQYASYNGKRIASRVAVKDGVPYLKEA